MGETKTVKEILVWPLDNPTQVEDFINPGNKVPSWQSRAVCNHIEAAALDVFLRTEGKALCLTTVLVEWRHE